MIPMFRRRAGVAVLSVVLAVPSVGRPAALDDYAAVVTSAPSLRHIMIIGDSIQAGTKLNRAHGQASWRLQRSTGIVVHTFASPGATMANSGFLSGMLNATTAVQLLHGLFNQLYGIIINLGLNDWGESVTISAFSSAYGEFIAAIPPGINVVCMSPTWSDREGELNAQGATLDDFRAATRTVCESLGATYLDGKEVIPNDASYFVDGLHPNERGHRAMSTFLTRGLRELEWVP